MSVIFQSEKTLENVWVSKYKMVASLSTDSFRILKTVVSAQHLSQLEL
jgi:hypothetical protein